MSIIHVNHIKADCNARFSGLVDVSDVNAKPEDIESHFLTRALAAFSLCALAKIEDREAANCVTDEPHDDGIDAFYYSSTEHVCYLVQSKWSSAGSGSIDVGSVLKFIQGFDTYCKVTLLHWVQRCKQSSTKSARPWAYSSATIYSVNSLYWARRVVR